MDRIKLYFNRNYILNSKNLVEKNPSNKQFNQRGSVTEKFSRKNVKGLLLSHSSSANQLQTSPSSSSLSNSNSNEEKEGSSESRSNGSSYDINCKKERRHSWNGDYNIYHRNFFLSSSIRRTKSFRYQNRRKQKKILRKIIEANRSTKSVRIISSTNINNQSAINNQKQISSIKTTDTNAFLTATSLFKYWVQLLTTFTKKKTALFF